MALGCILFSACAIAAAQQGVRSVITTRNLPAAPQQVLRAFVGDDELKAWWQVSRSLVNPVPGGVWSVAWDDWGAEQTQHSWSGVIEEIAADRLVVTNMVMNEPGMPLLGPMRLEIRIAATADGSSVTVTHAGYGYGAHWDEIYTAVVVGWDHILGDMRAWFMKEY
jgi:uncharacterized protein YndB with AHSA1/START domain